MGASRRAPFPFPQELAQIARKREAAGCGKVLSYAILALASPGRILFHLSGLGQFSGYLPRVAEGLP
jgi:hypothetical protein